MFKIPDSFSHRPWPVPSTPWVWRQSWSNLLFAHWPIEADQLRHLVPNDLEIDQYEGMSWIGVVPFLMENVTLRYLPNFGRLSRFPELNLRIYVKKNGRPGVWFLSLDAQSQLAVFVGRRLFNLPYFFSEMSINQKQDGYQYSTRRNGELIFSAVYQPESEVFEAEAGSLEYWLTERYCLYSLSANNKIYSADIHHDRWPLQKASAEIEENSLSRAFDLRLSNQPPLLHFSKKLDVIIWPASRA